MKNLLVASTSTIHGSMYLEYLRQELEIHFQHCKQLLFIPFARPGGISHSDYTLKVSEFFNRLDIEVIGLNACKDQIIAITNAEAIFTGGGNTFVLVNELHRLNLIKPLRSVIFNGVPYLGTSAGSNLCGITMQTTNDMPIIYPPSFQTLGVLPFNINPHYLDPIEGSRHMGETRETRINEFHALNNIPVVGLREGSWLDVKDESIILKGEFSARIFESGKPAYEVKSGTNLNHFN